MANNKARSLLSEKARLIHDKLEQDPTGDSLTRTEQALEVTREEAAHILSARAGRDITADYLRQLTRGDKPRLQPSRATGNTYLYRVGALLDVRFTQPHHREGKQAALPLE